MANIYDNDINKNTDWGGDSSTGGKPVSGRAVQKFIKDSLQQRVGYVYRDQENSRCVGFADQGDYELWVEDPVTYAELIITTWPLGGGGGGINYVYEDRPNRRCLGFASQADAELWEENPEEYASLIVTSWYNDFPAEPVYLDNPAYYGTVDNQITVANAASKVETLNSTVSLGCTCPSNKPYVYIMLFEEYTFGTAVTTNFEDIRSEFELKGQFTLDELTYNLYEFHLSSGLPLDVNINISFGKN